MVSEDTTYYTNKDIGYYVYCVDAESATQCAGVVITREPHRRRTRVRCTREPAESAYDPKTHKLFGFCTQHYQAMMRNLKLARSTYG